MAVHPRVRGEHGRLNNRHIPEIGSSPRARGTRRELVCARDLLRFIPACAGNTRKLSAAPPQCPVHPRVRGEHVAQFEQDGGVTGSSPRARGTHPPHPQRSAFYRFIPACAGNTASCSRSTRASAVHPRVRGEHADITQIGQIYRGSSPRARGTRVEGDAQGRQDRFIPACAGNTLNSSGTLPPCSVHPRVRGEHACFTALAAGTSGSSPRARGTQSKASLPADRSRFIPACAWGTQARCCEFRLASRFIPACAGNTSGTTLSGDAIPVHPRVRGEHSSQKPLI